MATTTGPLPDLDAETLEGLIGRVEVSVVSVKGFPAVITRLTYPPRDGTTSFVDEYVREDNWGRPWSGNTSWGAEADAAVYPRREGNLDHPLVRWLSGRWVLKRIHEWHLLESGHSPEAIECALDGLVRRIAADIRTAIREAAFSATFVEALETVSLWANGPRCDIGRLFKDMPKHAALRRLVRDNPFVTELTFRDMARHVKHAMLPPAEIDAFYANAPQDHLAAFRRGVWADAHSLGWVTKDVEHANDILHSALFSQTPRIAAANLPRTPEQAPAFIDLVRFLKARPDQPHKPDAGILLSKVGADWVGQASRCRAAVERMADAPCGSTTLADLLGDVSFQFVHKVLLPLAARIGTLDHECLVGSGGHLFPLADAILLAGKDIDGCLAVADAFHARRQAIRDRLPSDAAQTAPEWLPLFPDATVDGFVLRCLCSPASLISARLDHMPGDAGSLRAYAYGGWVHIVSVARPDAEPVAYAEITWRKGRWDAVTQLAAVRAGGDSARALSALASHLTSLPNAPRPTFEPPELHERVRDWAGYDWFYPALVAQACRAFEPILPPAYRTMDSLVEAVRKFELERPVPSHRGNQYPLDFRDLVLESDITA